MAHVRWSDGNSSGDQRAYPARVVLLMGVLACLVAASWGMPQPVIAQTPSDYTPIPAIQGAGLSSPLNGERVDTVGVVTGLTDTGFYLQDAQGDGDPATSDGLFVYTRTRPTLRVGECVAVQGATVEEFYAKTELNRAAAIVPADGCGVSAVAPVALPWVRPGEAAQAVWEPYEGMRVQVTGELFVHGPAKHFASGEWEIGVSAAALQAELGPGHLFHDMVIDGEPAANGLLFLSNRLGATLPRPSWSDRLTVTNALVGVVDYNFGKYQLLVAPGQTIGHVPAESSADALGVAPARADEYSVCSFNVYGLGRGSAQHADAEAYAQAVRARATVIAEQLAGCTVVALQETGAPDDAAALAAALRADHGLAYEATALPGPLSNDDEFPLTNSFIVRSDRVHVLGRASIQACTAEDYDIFAPGACSAGSYPVFDRPPLAIQVQIDGAWETPQTLWLINNHWKSKSGDETANARLRAAQARAVAEYVTARLAADPSAQIIVLGDLNDFYQGPAVGLLTAADGPGLVELHDFVPPLARYTYIFNGAAQVLDHVLVTPGLVAQLAGLRVVHAQTDRAMSPAADSLRVSDHDPLYVRLRPGGAAAVAANVGLGDVAIRAQAMSEAADGATPDVIQAMSDAQGEVRLWGLDPGAVLLALTPPVYGQFARQQHDAAVEIKIEMGPGAQVSMTFDLAPGMQVVDLPQAIHRAPYVGARLAHATQAIVARLIDTQVAAP